MKHTMIRMGLPVLIAMAAGCTTMGTGFGSAASGKSPVNFNWKSSDSVSGSMNASLSDGTTFSGKFFQITSDTTVDNLGPLWEGWGGYGMRGRWGGDWGLWDAGPEFVTHYSGKVVANLAATDGQHMRCNFQLVHPSEGMAGGGTGQCQLPKGNTIDANFPKA